MAARVVHRAVCARVPNRALLAVTGTNTAQFLNGLVSTTVPWPPNGGFYSTFLAANGKMLYDVFLWPFRDGTREGYLIDYDPRSTEDAPPLDAMLKKHVLRSRVKVQPLQDEYDVWTAWGGELNEPTRSWRYGSQGAVEPIFEDKLAAWSTKDDKRLRDLRAVGMGHRILTKKGEEPEETKSHDKGTEEDYTVHRILHGVPEGSVELVNSLPLNSNVDLMGGVDFRKGCYVGQELTVRTYHTGVVRRRIYPVQLYPENQSPREPETTDASIPPFSKPISITLTNVKNDGKPERGTRPKLLTSIRGVGLAALRSAQLGALDKGELEMRVNSDSGDTFRVRHWVPSWWPQQAIVLDDGGVTA